ncbi:MAG: glycosyltransferase family A protein [Planctomycetaceae bacterium]
MQHQNLLTVILLTPVLLQLKSSLEQPFPDRLTMSCASLVSVVIPTFNRARFIGETLESALSQTWKALEVIVVDDGSTDDTRQIVEEFAARDERVRYFHQANQGVSAARNHAIAQAQGEYVAFLDSDDLWHPWKLAIQMELLQAAPHVGMCWTNMDAISGTGELLSLNYLRKMYSAYSLLPDGKLFASLEPLGRHCPRIAPEFANTLCGIGTIYRQMFQGTWCIRPRWSSKPTGSGKSDLSIPPCETAARTSSSTWQPAGWEKWPTSMRHPFCTVSIWETTSLARATAFTSPART